MSTQWYTIWALLTQKCMTRILKAGDQLNHDGKQWTITEVAEDNEGQVVYHLKCGEKLSVLKESDLANELNVEQKQARSGDKTFK